MQNNKDEAYQFLKALQEKLNEDLPSADRMRALISEVVQQARSDDTMKHMRQPEDAFLHYFAFPVLFEHMQTVEGMDSEAARASLLSEYYRNMPQFSRDTPARKKRHPLNKVIGVTPDEIMKQWRGEGGCAKLKQSCPDFAFREPFPFKIVFEGKYFSGGGLKKAETELVTNVYQAFFYRGLPYDQGLKGRPDWDYDYSCLFAYDASEDGTLVRTWESLDSDVKQGFWEGANLFVMLLRS